MKKRVGQKIITFLLILSMATGWLFSGWPRIFNFPPEIPEAQAAVAKAGTDTSVTDGGAISSTSFSHTLIAGSNRMVAVSVGIENNGDIDVSSVTYGGVAMTKAIDIATGTSGYIYLTEIWYILEANLPSDGSQTVAITLSTAGSSDMEINALCAEYTGVNQGVPEATDSISSTANPIVNTISPSTDSWVISAVGVGNKGTFTHGQSQVELLDANDASSGFAVAELRGASGETSLDSTFSASINRGVRIAASWTEAPTYTLTQNDWRWYENADSVQPGTAKANENTAITGVTNGEVLRTRMNITVGGANMPADSKAFKLQYGQGTDCTAIGTWNDVGAIDSATIWRGYNNSTPSDGATIGVSDYLLSTSDVAESYEEENNSVNNPRAINQNQDGERDWVVQSWGAAANTTYCFRMVESGGTVLDTYNSDGYPKLTTVTSATWREAEDTAIPTASSALDKNTNVRLRIEVANTGFEAENYDYRLEYASTATNCSSDPGGWVTVPDTPTTEHFDMTTSTYFVDGYPTTARLANSESYTFTAGTMVEDNSNSSGNITLDYHNYTEIEFVFQANNNATDGGTYCFRVTKAGTALNSYDVYPELRVSGVVNQAPTVDSVSINPSPITLNPDTTKTVTITATITDNDGCEDVFVNGSIAGVFFDDAVENDTCTQDDNDCYPSLTLTEVDNTCTGPGDYTADASVDVDVWFIANPSSNWTAKVTATDEASESGSNTQTVTVNTLNAFELDISNIGYGIVDPDNISNQQAVLITTTGNAAIDVQLSGTNLTWSGNTIDVSQQKYSANTSFDWETQGTALTDTATCHELSTGKPTEHPSVETENVYWKLKVPTGKPAGGPYSGTNYFDVVSETTCP